MENIRFLSYGGGVQTTDMLIRYPERYDFAVFADVSKGTKFDEKAKTYWYIDKFVKPFCEKQGIEFITVEPKKSLFDYCIEHNLIPTRDMRWCTDRSKKEPIYKWARENGATRKEPFFEDIGFSHDEYWRAGVMNPPKYLQVEYPLVDDKITREQCKKNILDKFGVVPPKSGCVYCPHASKFELRQTGFEEKEKVPKIVMMEKNNSRYPEITLKSRQEQIRGKKLTIPIPIETLLNADGSSLDSFLVDDSTGCESGHCFL